MLWYMLIYFVYHSSYNCIVANHLTLAFVIVFRGYFVVCLVFVCLFLCQFGLWSLVFFCFFVFVFCLEGKGVEVGFIFFILKKKSMQKI